MPCFAGLRPELLPAFRAIVTDDLGRYWAEATTPSGFELWVSIRQVI